MRLEAVGKTDVGLKRAHNEDCFFILEEENLHLVADGMGGHACGEVASKMAVETIANFYNATVDDEEVTWPFKMDKEKCYDENRMVTGVKLANLRIFETALAEKKYKGMGTTVVGTFFGKEGAAFTNVGDSRIYLCRHNTLTQLTEDHSLLNDYIKMGKLTPEEIESFPHKNVIVRALGMKDTVQVDVDTVVPIDGDLFLLCSDGLSSMISDEEILKIMSNGDELEKICDQLIGSANEAGGADNITVIIVRYNKE